MVKFYCVLVEIVGLSGLGEGSGYRGVKKFVWEMMVEKLVLIDVGFLGNISKSRDIIGVF